MTPTSHRRFLAAALAAAFACGAGSAMLGQCGPFSDVTDATFCPFVLEIFSLGITTGTTATTFDPAASVSRLQMAAFLSRTVDRSLARGNRRAALGQFWTTKDSNNLGLTTVGTGPTFVRSDGRDLWVTESLSGSIGRVRAGDGKYLETWTGATAAGQLLPAMGKVFLLGSQNPGVLYRIDPSQPAGAIPTVAFNLGANPNAITYDGSKVWTSNGTSISRVTPGPSIPWAVSTVTAGFTSPAGIVYDGANVWVADFAVSTLLKLDSAGAVLQTVTVGSIPRFPFFDGTNIWVSNGGGNSVTVVKPSTGAVLATLTGNGLSAPNGGAFDGQRVLITTSGGDVVSLWKAADLTPLGSFSTGGGTSPISACSDGVDFWIALTDTNRLARF